ncbi:hypothetical protein R6M67_11720 [Streptomyces sp. Wh19]|nr:hypothetical protein [Streptomyces sp. Wh19]MDV9196012.1 hypothetical protein [Streptomyces sp. Wh19]
MAETPALATMTDSSPVRAVNAVSAAVTASWSLTGAAAAAITWPGWRAASAGRTRSSSSPSRSSSSTWHPARAKASAIARPRPRAAPVTHTELPLRSG